MQKNCFYFSTRKMPRLFRNPASIYLFKVNNENTITICAIFVKLTRKTRKTSKRHHWTSKCRSRNVQNYVKFPIKQRTLSCVNFKLLKSIQLGVQSYNSSFITNRVKSKGKKKNKIAPKCSQWHVSAHTISVSLSISSIPEFRLRYAA